MNWLQKRVYGLRDAAIINYPIYLVFGRVFWPVLFVLHQRLPTTRMRLEDEPKSMRNPAAIYFFRVPKSVQVLGKLACHSPRICTDLSSCTHFFASIPIVFKQAVKNPHPKGVGFCFALNGPVRVLQALVGIYSKPLAIKAKKTCIKDAPARAVIPALSWSGITSTKSIPFRFMPRQEPTMSCKA